MKIITEGKVKGWVIWAIFVIAFLPRLWAVVFSSQVPGYDALCYDYRAMFIVKGDGFGVTSCKDPFYSVFLAGVYYLFGHSYLIIRLIQAVLGALVCVFIFLISRRFFSVKASLLGALFACFNPAFIRSCEYILTENLCTFLLITALFLFIKYVQERRLRDLCLSGFIFGLSALTRSILLYFPLFIAMALSRSEVVKNGIKKYLLHGFIFILFFILPIMPWMIRNYQVHHAFVPISTNTGLAFYTCYKPKDGKLFGFTTQDAITKKSEEFSSEVERSNFLVKEALKYIKGHPLKVLKLEVLKILYYWVPFDWEIIGGGKYNFLYGFILPFFVYGAFMAIGRPGGLALLYLPVAYSFLMALVTYGSPRMRLPFEPYIIIIAAAGLVCLINRFPRKFFILLAIVTFFILNLFLYFNSGYIKEFIKSIIFLIF